MSPLPSPLPPRRINETHYRSRKYKWLFLRQLCLRDCAFDYQSRFEAERETWPIFGCLLVCYTPLASSNFRSKKASMVRAARLVVVTVENLPSRRVHRRRFFPRPPREHAIEPSGKRNANCLFYGVPLGGANREVNMARITKHDVQRGIDAAREMLERNASTIDTFEGVLSRRYVRNLKTLIVLGEHYLESRPSGRLTVRQSTQK